MSYNQAHPRQYNLFHKGMTLEDYVRGMDSRDTNIPTADTYDNLAEQTEQCLYKTTHNFYNPPPKPNVSSIKEIEEESFDDSIQHHRDSKNIVSTNLKKMGKQSLIAVEDQHIKYRIRKAGSMSPYGIKNKKADFSPTKTFGGKFYKFEQHLPKQFLITRNNKSPTLISINEQMGTSSKKLPKPNIHSIHSNNSIQENAMAHKMNFTSSRWHKNEAPPNKFMTALEKVDLRVETFKGRLDKKKKDRKMNN